MATLKHVMFVVLGLTCYWSGDVFTASPPPGADSESSPLISSPRRYCYLHSYPYSCGVVAQPSGPLTLAPNPGPLTLAPLTLWTPNPGPLNPGVQDFF